MFSATFNTVRGLTDTFGNEHGILSRISVDKHYPFDSDDSTCLATARILLFNRLPEDETLTLRSIKESWPIPDTQLPKSFNIVHTTDDSFAASHPAYTKLEKAENYLSKWLSCQIFVNHDINSAVVFSQELDTRKTHMLMSLLPLFIKTPFDEKPLTDDEKKLCFSMTKRTSGDFESMIAKLVRQSGLENELNEVLLKRFANVELERSIDETNNTLRVARAALEDNVAEYARLVQKVNDATIKYEALLARPKNESTELVDYFKRHKNLQLVNVSDGTIKFYVKTTADWFDLDFYRRASSNGSIYRMTADPPFCKVEDRKLLMDAIFSDDPVFRIRLCAIYALNTDVAVFRNYEYPEELTRQYLPNPHLQYHQCLGSYRDPIRTAIRNSNYIGAIEQCVASCQSINLAETGVTFIPFMKRLFATTKKEKVLIDKDGNEYNAKEALEKLKEQK